MKKLKFVLIFPQNRASSTQNSSVTGLRVILLAVICISEEDFSRLKHIVLTCLNAGTFLPLQNSWIWQWLHLVLCTMSSLIVIWLLSRHTKVILENGQLFFLRVSFFQTPIHGFYRVSLQSFLLCQAGAWGVALGCVPVDCNPRMPQLSCWTCSSLDLSWSREKWGRNS